MRKPNLWHAWTLTILLSVFAYYLYTIDILGYLLDNDVTRLTLIIPVLGLLVSLSVVYMLLTNTYPRWLYNQIYYTVDHFTSLGLLGTVIGLIFMIRNGVPEPTDLLIGTGTALLTTLVGIAFTLYGNQMLLQLEEGRERAGK